MKRTIYYFIGLTCFCLTLYSCEGCVKKVAKSVTNLGLDVLEGVTEVVQERGDSIGTKILDASGKVAEGAGRSLSRQLDEHAEHVAQVAGAAVVQTLDGLGEGFSKEYYDEIPVQKDLCSDVTLDFLGKIKERAVTDAYFTILKEGTYKFKFEFCTDDSCETSVFTKTAVVSKTDMQKNTTVVSFAYNQEEEVLLKTIKRVKITVEK